MPLAVYLTVSVTPVPTLAHTLDKPINVVGATGAVVVMLSVLTAAPTPHSDLEYTLILPDTKYPLAYLMAIHELSVAASTICMVEGLDIVQPKLEAPLG